MRLLSCLIVAVLTFLTPPLHAADHFDVIIRGGRIVDGTGAPWYIGDVGIADGRIVKIGRLTGEAKRVVDATGLYVTPGFIDMMGQTGSPLIDNPAAAMNLLMQGITTINAGEGVSAAPLAGDAAKTAGWSTMREYFAKLDAGGMPINVAQTVGHTQVRRLVLGDIDRRPSPEELQQMQALVKEAMEAGAIGMSTALIYPPAVYASTEELVALTRVAGEHGGGYFTHMRNEGDRLLEAIEEALHIGAEGKARVHIFHLKAAGRQNWGKMELAIARIKAARASGQQVAADIYPYINNGLGITAFIHPRHAAEGPVVLRRKLDDAKVRAEIRAEMETRDDYENWYRHIGFDWDRLVLGEMRGDLACHNGKSLLTVAKLTNRDPWDLFFDVAKQDAFVLPQTMSEANLVKAIQTEYVSFCTDVGPAGGSSIASHPRAYGALSRVLSRFVRDLGAISLERAVAQMSAVAANELFAYDRGRIAPGQAADIAIFDYATVMDKATFAEPHLEATGMKYVLVNGQIVLEGGKYTGARPGRVLRGPGYRPE